MLKAIALGQMLTKNEMKEVKGGGSCCAHNSDWSQSQCNISRADAKDSASGCDDWNWCCASCDLGDI